MRWAEGVFLAAVGAERKPATIALLQELTARPAAARSREAIAPYRRPSLALLPSPPSRRARRRTAHTLRARRAPSEHWALVDRYCVTCHNDAERAGELAFDKLDREQPARPTRPCGKT